MPRLLSIALGLLMVLGALAFLGWLMARSLKRSDDPTRLVVKWILSAGIAGVLVLVLGKWGPSYGSAFAVPFVCVALGIALSVIWAPSLGNMLSRPLTSLFDGGFEAPDLQPFYSIAQAKRKKGHPQEALWDIQQQLEKFPHDFTGQILMAEIQAEDLHDLQAATLTIQRICNQPGQTPANTAAALTRLADWHISQTRDGDSARQVLEEIIQRLPDTPWSHVATQRIAHLASPRDLIEAQDRRPILVPQGVKDLGLHPERIAPPASESPSEEAEKLVKHLEEFPLDNDAREQLATIYAVHYQRPDMAMAELEQLIGQANVPPKRIAHWLNLMADFQLHQQHDEESARQTLQRIIDLFPGHPVADLASHRQAHLRLEMRKDEAARVIKLGSYEPNLGMKMPPWGKPPGFPTGGARPTGERPME